MSIFNFDEPIDLPLSRRDVFIDTGAHLGMSMQHALDAGFKEVVGIELVEEYVHKLAARFKDMPHVKLHHGSSPCVLGSVLSQYEDRDVTIWHDAHYQGNNLEELDPAVGECPLLGELRIVMNRQVYQKRKPMLYIDDAFMLYPEYWEEERSKEFKRSEWPTIEQIEAIIGSAYTLTRKQFTLVCV